LNIAKWKGGFQKRSEKIVLASFLVEGERVAKNLRGEKKGEHD